MYTKIITPLLMLNIMCLSVAGCSDSTKEQQTETSADIPKSALNKVVVEESKPLTQYQHQMIKLLSYIKAKEKSTEIAAQSQILIDQINPVYDALIKVYPDCKAYLKGLDAKKSELLTSTTTEIEGHFLGVKSDPAFNEPICYHAKNLLIYSAIIHARALNGFAQSDGYKQVSENITLAIAHFKQVEQAINLSANI